MPAGALISAGKSGRVERSLPKQSGGIGELRAGQLHAVAAVAGEAHDDLGQLLGGRIRAWRRRLGLGGSDHDREIFLNGGRFPGIVMMDFSLPGLAC